MYIYITGGQKKLSITVNTFYRQILNVSEKRYNSKLLESMNLWLVTINGILLNYLKSPPRRESCLNVNYLKSIPPTYLFHQSAELLSSASSCIYLLDNFHTIYYIYKRSKLISVIYQHLPHKILQPDFLTNYAHLENFWTSCINSNYIFKY